MKRLMLPFFVLVLSVLPGRAQQPRLHKLSPMLRELVIDRARVSRGQAPAFFTGSEASPAVRAAAPGAGREPSVCAFVRMEGDAERIFSDHGCRELAHVGNIYIASIPLSSLGPLSQERAVSRIEARRGTQALMDSMAIHLNALSAYAGTALPQAYTGSGVVVGVMDIGFDLTHPNFYDPTASHYRIQRFWDQLSTDTVGSPYYVGRDYRGQQELLQLGCSYDGTSQTHGTHTLGIAAGSGYDSPYRGMAWESDICIVANATTEDIALIDTADYYKYTYATDALGFKYIFDYARSVGKPCVASFSEGSAQDFYGYDQLYYEMLDSLTGPGCILVASAGNNGNVLNYMHKERQQERVGMFIRSTTDRVALTVKADGPFLMRNVVYGSEGTDTIYIDSRMAIAQPDSLVSDTAFSACGRTYYYTLAAYPSCYNPDETCYDIRVRMLGRMGYDIPVSFEFMGTDAELEVYRQSGTIYPSMLNTSLQDAVTTHTIHSPSSAPGVICVGATGYRTGFFNFRGDWHSFDQGNDGRRSSYSSRGPTYDNRIKPDVMAPGSNIVSSYSSYYLEHNPEAGDILSDVEHFDFNNRTYAWNSNAGTSMATPAAAGAIALWLQAKPTLTPAEVLDVIAHTSSHYDETLSYPNNEYGYGQIDVYRGLLYILGIDAVEGLSAAQPSKAAIGLSAPGRVTVVFDEPTARPVTLSVYSTAGARLLSSQQPAGRQHYELDLQHLPRGVYAVQVDAGTAATSGSSLVRW